MRWRSLVVATAACALGVSASHHPSVYHRSAGTDLSCDRHRDHHEPARSDRGSSLQLPHFKPQTREYTLELSNRWLALDGYWRETYAVNGQTPGPPIEGNEGDTFRVTIVNNLGVQTSMHMHGLEMPMSQDGVPGVNQFNILPYSNYTYEWTAKNYGPSWYHSHAAATYADGLRGPILLHPKPERARPWEAISKDVQEQQSMEEAYQNAGSLMLHDWRHETMENALTRYRYTGQDPYCIDSLLINSQGRNYCYDVDYLKPIATLQAPFIEGLDTSGCVGSVFGFRNQLAKVNPNQCDNTSSAFLEYKSSVYGSRDGQYAAFHIVNAGTEFETCFSIDGHDMWVVAADGPFVRPQKVQILDTQIGQRYTVIVPLKDAGRYTIRASLCNNMPQIKSGYAVLHVEDTLSGSTGNKATHTRPKNDDLDHDEDSEENQKRQKPKYVDENDDGLPELRLGLTKPKVQPYIPAKNQEHLPFQRAKFSNGMKPTEGMHVTNELGKSGKQWMQYNGSAMGDVKVSNYSLMPPWTKHDIPAKSTHTLYFNLNITNGVSWALNTDTFSSLNSQGEPLLWSKNPPTGAAVKNTVIHVPVGGVIDIIHQAAKSPIGNPLHPIHKHQNKVWVLGMGSGQFPYKSVIEAQEKQPDLLDLENPPFRDSWHIPAGGWVVTRHRVLDKGVTIQHCHLVQHLAAGMMVIFVQGDALDPSEIPSNVLHAPHATSQYIPMDGKIGLDI